MTRSRLFVAVCMLIPLILIVAGPLAFRPHTVRGVVADADGPVAGATVRLRGSLSSTTTDADGRFVLHFRGPALHRAVTAWKEGYYPAGVDLSLAASLDFRSRRDFGSLPELTLSLKPHPIADDPSYAWLTSHPDPNVALGCGHCMAAYDEWKLDAHALSATNSRFLSVYNGTDLDGQPAAGPGFRLDSPQDAGNCAVCHAPAAALAHDGNADMNRLSGVETEGVLCDLCHKIGGVTLDEGTGLPHQGLLGVLAVRLYRPASGTQVFFGTLDDIPRRVSYSQLEKESRFCAPCHSGGWWGVSAYASYDEWLTSPYAAEGVTCQACHMPPSGGTSTLTSSCAPAMPPLDFPGLGDLGNLICRARACMECHRRPAEDPARNPLPDFTLIPDRPAETIHTHRMTGVRDETFMRGAVTMVVTATQGDDGVLAEVSITNLGAGHHVPSDSPLRNMILLVTARDPAGNPLPYLGTQVVPAWGGEGPIEAGNYAGLPGKGFAKVLEDWDGNSPAPQWRNGIHILSDNRIPARATDLSHYTFALPSPPSRGQPEGNVTIEAKLIFRRAFKPWADAKGWDEPDLVMAEATVTATRVDGPVVATLPVVYNTKLFAPSQATTASGERLASTDFASPEQCRECHAGPAAGWTESGHAQATTRPLYRAWYKAAVQDTQGQMGRFCAGCHTPIGLLSGQIRSRWAWNGRESYPLDDPAQSGISCVVCHSIVATTGEGNGAYVVASDGVSGCQVSDLRFESSAAEPETLELATGNASSELCAACHEATNPSTGLPVMTTYSEWQHSPFNTGDLATTTTCQDCHFADGRHGALRLEDLQAAARIEILPPAEVIPGEELELKVIVSNVAAGHDLPTGSAELRQMWLTVVVTDATWQEVFSSGRMDAYGDPVEGTMTYGVTWQDAAGHSTDRLWEAARPMRDRRIAAGSSAVETYHFTLPAAAQGPLRIRAALNTRAAAGYLTSLMTVYLGEDVPLAPVIEMVTAEISR